MLSKIGILLLVASSCLAQYNDDLQQQQEPARGGGGGYQQQEGVQENENSAGGGNGIEPLDPSVPEPPSQIPETSFVCDGKPYDPGMYADEETNCRVYHMCYRGRKESFICGTGTVFNQEILSCDYPDNVDCAQSQSFYSANTELGKSSPEPAPGGQTPTQQRPQQRPSNPRPAPAGGQQQPDSSYGGAQDAEGDAGQDGYDQAPAPVTPARPRPNPRPAAGGKTPAARPPPAVAAPRPDYGGVAPAPRPVQRPQKTNPVRPRPAVQKPRPQQRPAERPIVQSNQELSLDYEPSSQVIQRRSSRQLTMTRRNPSKRWQMYSQDS